MENEAEYDDEPLTLSAETLKALQEFQMERETRSHGSEDYSENWQMSQFWYDEKTSSVLSEEVLKSTNDGDWIACVCCPSLYKELLKSNQPLETPTKELNIVLLEFDERFHSLAGEHFLYYDYNSPTNIPPEFVGKFDFVAVDPPFLSQECLAKVATTVDILRKPEHNGKILLCTGEIMEQSAEELLSVRKRAFSPRHKNKLSNVFACFTNYDPAVLNSIQEI